MSKCDTCKKIVVEAIDYLPENLGCKTASAAWVAAVEAIGLGPFDPLADAVAAGGAAVIYKICSEYGYPYIKENKDKVAKTMCITLKMC